MLLLIRSPQPAHLGRRRYALSWLIAARSASVWELSESTAAVKAADLPWSYGESLPKGIRSLPAKDLSVTRTGPEERAVSK